MKGFLLRIAAASVVVGITACTSAPSGPPDISPISPANVARLEQAWIYRTGEPLTPVPGGGRPPAFEATPVYADGLLFIGTPYGRAIALDPETGEERWSFDARIDRQGNYGDFANRGVTYWRTPAPGDPCPARIFFATIDARLFALDAATGRPCPDFGAGGMVDLTKGLRRGPSYTGEYQQTSPPAVVAGVVVVGSAIADNNRQDAPSGEVRGFDALTGKLLWSWDPLPGNPDAGGANTWSRITADHERGLVFLPTGSASPDYYGGLRPGDNRYANSVVALEARTGRMVWHFQTVHHDLWDYDVVSPPTLYEVQRDGQTIPAIAVGSKTGHLFLLDRETGEPLFPVVERPVPQSDVPGEKTSPTQPFPTLPPSLVPQTVSDADIWGPTETDRDACQAAIAGLRNEGIFTPPSLRGTLVVPGNIGGMQWGGAAFDAGSGLLVVPANHLPALVRLIPQAEVDAYRKQFPDRENTRQRGTPYAMSREFLRSPSGLPCVRPPFGTLTAVDTVSGQIRWQVPLGALPGADPAWGSINLGGPLATNGVIFIGAALDPVFRAFHAQTGKELWRAQLPASARSVPATFTAASGAQYIVVAAGGHMTQFGKLDNAIVAFGLPNLPADRTK